MNRKTIKVVMPYFVLLIILIVINRIEGFAGTDDQAIGMIEQLRQGYRPWFKSIWEPYVENTEQLFFIIQGMIGGGFIIYYIRHKLKCSKKYQHTQR